MIWVNGTGAFGGLLAAGFWLYSAWLIEVPDNIETLVPALQRINYYSGWGATFAAVAAICTTVNCVVKRSK